MGLFLDKPKKEKERSSGEGNGLKYAVCAMQGWRVDMEDSHSVQLELAPWLKELSYFAVFDGHAGDFVSKYCAANLMEEFLKGIAKHLKQDAGNGDCNDEVQAMETEEPNAAKNAVAMSSEATKPVTIDTSHGNHEKGESRSAKASIDEGNESRHVKENCKSTSLGANSDRTTDYCLGNNEQEDLTVELIEEKISNDKLKSIVCKGFLDMDERLKALEEFSTGEERSGSTAIAVFVSSKQLIFANCGDSRALLCRNGQPFFVTFDHKPYNEEEKCRIEKAGGSVIIQRVNGSLAVSRSLGDFDYKRVPDIPCTAQLVSAEPELNFIERSDDDEFMVLACDGIWDVMSNKDVVEYVQSRLKVRKDLDAVCEDLLETCLAKGSRDNMSAIIVTFPGAPKFCEEAAEKETKVNEVIKEKVEEVVGKSYDKSSNTVPIDIDTVFEVLQQENISGLPPGGGLQAKFPLIEQILEGLLPDQMKNENQRYGGAIPVSLNMMKQFGGDAGVGPSEEAEEPTS